MNQRFLFCRSIWSEPSEGNVCRKCWLKVFIFHEFYAHIESIHGSQLTIFVGYLPQPNAVKSRLSSSAIEEKWDDFNDNVFDDGGINDLPVRDDDCDFFGDIVEQPDLKKPTATAKKTIETPKPKKTRKRMPGGYKRKYDRRIRHDYSTFQ